MRKPANLSRAGILAVVMGAAWCGAAPAPDGDFHDIPYIYTQTPDVFRALFQRGHRATVRALMLGDSQETCPGGRGSVYVPRFNYELFLRYGNCPETPVLPMLASTGGGVPWAQWLAAEGLADPGVTGSRLLPEALPPNMLACASSTTDGHNVNNNQSYGQLLSLEHDAARVDPDTGIAGASEFFVRGQSCYLDVYGATNSSSGEIVVRVAPTPGWHMNYYAPTTQVIVTSMGLESPFPAILHQRVGPLFLAGQQYLQVELYGSDPAKLTDIVAAKFVGTVDTHGCTVTNLAAGGYTATDFFTRHGACGPYLRALDPDLVYITYGANDSAHSFSPAEFRVAVQQLIAFVRAGVGRAVPVVLIADPYRVPGGPDEARSLDRYPGECYAIALLDPLVCALNSRRRLDELGWNSTGAGMYLRDSVHYSPAGAILKSQVEVQMLFEAFDPRACPADFNGDGTANLSDFVAFLSAYAVGDARADQNSDGTVSGRDLLDFLVAYAQGCAESQRVRPAAIH